MKVSRCLQGWRPRLLDRYLFKAWAKTMLVVLWLILGVLLLEDMSRNLKHFIEQGVDAKTILHFYAFITPQCLGIALPVSFFISVLYTLNALQAHNEITALRASGLTIFSITRSFWFAAILLMLSLIAFNAHLLPYASRQTADILEHIHYENEKKEKISPNEIGMKRHLCFYNSKAKRLWHIHRFSLYTNRGAFTTLSFFDHNKQEYKRLEARAVAFDPTTHTWHFQHGRIWELDPSNAIPNRFRRFQTETFPCEETPLLMDQIAKPIKTLGMHDLKSIVDFFPNDATQVIQHRIEYAAIVSSPLICLIIMLIAIPFSLNGVRINPMVGVSKAIGLLFVYYITCGIGRVLGTQQTLSPTMAAWFPNTIMLVIAAGLYRVCAPK